MKSLFAVVTSAVFGMSVADNRPNIVFLICESTDGRTYREGFAPVPIPSIRKLANEGTQFDTHYANVPVCCPSRASTWSGRMPHKIPHKQVQTGIPVGGVWNNYEGLPLNYDQKIQDVLSAEGYNVKINGKEDWNSGGHSVNVRLSAWTMYTQFPYSVNETGGWYDESLCSQEPIIHPDSNIHCHNDWIAVNKTTTWIRSQKDSTTPFFAYQGMTIVHPPYVTNEYWYNKIDLSKVTLPEWRPLLDMHPCDFESSMLKECTPSDLSSPLFYNATRRVGIRAVYYAMIAEFDAMVGAIVESVEDAGKTDNTIIIVTSDHGDMNMEHQQFYKMVQYDASSRVPLVIKTPFANDPKKALVTSATSHIDLFPTIMEYAQVPKEKWPSVLDGNSLVPFVNGSKNVDSHQYAVSQFHGDNIAMSWFHVTDGEWKYVVFGTGEEVAPQLFNLRNDISEKNNVATGNPEIVKKLDEELRRHVDYVNVSNSVAKYNFDSFKAFQKYNTNWKQIMENKSNRWSVPFHANLNGSYAALDQWLSEVPKVKACRLSLNWSRPL